MGDQMPLALDYFATRRGKGPLVVGYGGGWNTIAMLEQLRRLGERPDAILMSDPGSEWPETYAYRDEVANPWLDRIGFPRVTVVTLGEEARHRPRAHLYAHLHTTLIAECVRIKSLPSIAYFRKKCSQKWKARPANWWMERQPWVQAAWAKGQRITRAIGYDAGEDRRAKTTFMEPDEALKYVPYYPLQNAKIDREGCGRLIIEAGLPLPHKSACFYCPSNTLEEWRELLDAHPDLYEEAAEMSRNAEVTSPEVVGLMSCNPHGKRQLHLHVWQEGEGKARGDEEEGREALPCDCAL